MIEAKNTTRKVVLIHGYSDKGDSFRAWAAKLAERKISTAQINICNYVSLNNDVTIPDIGEGLARAIKDLGWSDDQEFDAIVHSTGMLVIRAFLINNASRPRNLKHLVGLAPATWGSPLAAEGRSWLGALVKGNKHFGPDFLNAGDCVLDGLELGSKFTWDLAHRDLLSDPPLFTSAPDSPYVAVFIGNTAYPGIKELIDKPATDGTVRWAGCGLNTRKIVVDLRSPGLDAQILPWANERQTVPMFAVEGKNHTTLLEQPEDDLADRIVDFFNVPTAEDYDTWRDATAKWAAPALEKMKRDPDGQPNDGWQQFVIRVTDEYGSPVPDYVVDLFKGDPTGLEGKELSGIDVDAFDLDVHPYRADQSFRCFHVRLPLGVTTKGAGTLWMRLTASSGTELIAYHGYGTGVKEITADAPVVLDISHLGSTRESLFHPFTTTLIEIRIVREPLPLKGQTKLLQMALFGG